MNINFGIIGCGNISRKFAGAVNYVENANLLSVAASKKEKAEDFAHKFGATNAYGNYDELIADKDVDIIYIGLTNNYHYEICKKCFASGKNVLCEKPLTLSYEQTKELCEIAKSNNVLFMEAMWTRCLPAYKQAKSWADGGKIGKITTIDADFCFVEERNENSRLFNKELGGGALYDLGVYAIDFAIGIMNKKPIDVNSMIQIGSTDVDEYSAITMKFDDDVIAALKVGIRASKPVVAKIHGDKGYIIVDDFYAARDCYLYNNNNELIDTLHDDIENGFVYEVKHVMEMFSTKKNESWLMPLKDTIYCSKLISDCLNEKESK